MAVWLRTDIARKVSRRIGVTILVAIEAGHTPHTVGLLGLAICRRIELLLRKLCYEQAQTIELLRIENAIEQLVKVINRYDLSFRNIAEIGPGGQENRGRKFRTPRRHHR